MAGPLGPPPGRVGGRFVLGELIGRGSSAEVYAARDDLLGREVAVKLFAVGPAESARSRAGREMRALAALDHPGIVTIYDVGEADGRLYLVMQLVRGGPLGQRLEHGPLALLEVLFLAAEVLVALDHVHAQGAVHRDLGPANILLDPDADPDGGDHRAGPTALIGDFGVASLVGATSVTTRGEIVGTAAYLAPEQVRGEPVGAPADIYALGLVLIECLTGEREYPGGPIESSVARLHRAPVVPAGLPAALAGLLSAMTAFDPHQRPTAAEALVRNREAAAEAGLAPETLAVPTTTAPPTATPSGGPGSLTAAPDTSGVGDGPAALPRQGPTSGEAPAVAATAPPRPSRRRGLALALGLAGLAAVVLAVLGLTLLSRPAGVGSPGARLGVVPAPSAPPAAIPPVPIAAPPSTAARPPASNDSPPPTSATSTTTTSRDPAPPDQPDQPDQPEQPGPGAARLVINGGEPISKDADDQPQPQAYAECPNDTRPQALRTPYLGTPRGWYQIGGRGYWARLAVINAAPRGTHTATVDCGVTTASTTFIIR